MIVTGHQPNFIPGVSVTTKIAAADIFIVCDEMQYVRHSFCNRNRFTKMENGETTYDSWMTVPINSHDNFSPGNQVRISDPHFRARSKVAKTMEMKMGSSAAPFVAEILRPWELLIGMNVSLLRVLCDGLKINTPWVFQSHLATGVKEPTVSERIAAMVAELGGDTWLSGPSGVKYLEEQPFADRGIEVTYWSHSGLNPTSAELLCDRRMEVAA